MLNFISVKKNIILLLVACLMAMALPEGLEKELKEKWKDVFKKEFLEGMDVCVGTELEGKLLAGCVISGEVRISYDYVMYKDGVREHVDWREIFAIVCVEYGQDLGLEGYLVHYIFRNKDGEFKMCKKDEFMNLDLSDLALQLIEIPNNMS